MTVAFMDDGGEDVNPHRARQQTHAGRTAPAVRAISRAWAPCEDPARGSPDAPEAARPTDDRCGPMRSNTRPAPPTRAGYGLPGCPGPAGRWRPNARGMVRLAARWRWPALALAVLAFLSPKARCPHGTRRPPWTRTGE